MFIIIANKKICKQPKIRKWWDKHKLVEFVFNPIVTSFHTCGSVFELLLLFFSLQFCLNIIICFMIWEKNICDLEKKRFGYVCLHITFQAL